MRIRACTAWVSSKQWQDLQRLLEQREPQQAARQRGRQVGEQDVGKTVLAEHSAIGHIHQQAEDEGPAHADTAELAHAPEAKHQCHPVRHAWPVGGGQEI
jgi:cell fate (sporulation/competence/biofilm development) regulator YlbF (YheA/YmcA/DUF963 family)